MSVQDSATNLNMAVTAKLLSAIMRTNGDKLVELWEVRYDRLLHRMLFQLCLICENDGISHSTIGVTTLVWLLSFWSVEQ